MVTLICTAPGLLFESTVERHGGGERMPPDRHAHWEVEGQALHDVEVEWGRSWFYSEEELAGELVSTWRVRVRSEELGGAWLRCEQTRPVPEPWDPSRPDYR